MATLQDLLSLDQPYLGNPNISAQGAKTAIRPIQTPEAYNSWTSLLNTTLSNFLDSVQNSRNLDRQTFGDPKRPLHVTDQNALSKLIENTMNGPMSFAPMGMTAWHGSPHTFNKFDMSKIGTGKGAQAYGHKLYLAENPEVAKEYKEALSTYKTTLNGEPLNPSHPLFSEGMSIAANGYKKALKQAEDALKSGFVNPEYAQKQIDNIKSLKGAKIEQSKQGNLYKVDLPDEHIEKMLDWDKPLSQQHPDVQKAIQKTKALLPQNAMDDLGGDLSLLYGKDITPKDFLNTWESLTGSVGSGEAALAKHGVPGIKYLDETSRQAGQGTRNFVIFDPNIAKIEERNSVPIPQDPHQPNYLDDLHTMLGLKSKDFDISDVYSPTYLGDLHSFLSTQPKE